MTKIVYTIPASHGIQLYVVAVHIASNLLGAPIVCKARALVSSSWGARVGKIFRESYYGPPDIVMIVQSS